MAAGRGGSGGGTRRDSGRGTEAGPEGGQAMRLQGGRLARATLVGVGLVAPGMLRAQRGAAPPADTAAKKPDPPPPPVNHLETTLAGFKLTGFAVGSYSYSGHSAGGTAIVGRLYDRLQNRFMLNALAVVLDQPYDPTKFSAGLHTDVRWRQQPPVNPTHLRRCHPRPHGAVPPHICSLTS